jgi:hypothetical protein
MADRSPLVVPARYRRDVDGLSRRCRAQGLAICRVDSLGFNFGQLLKSLRHALHPIGMVLFDQRFVGFLNLCDCGRLGNSENTNPVFIALDVGGRRSGLLTVGNNLLTEGNMDS